MRFVALTALFVAGCGDDGPSMSPMPDAGGVQVSGCDDPNLWTAPALTPATLYPRLTGGPCSGAQYPLSTIELGASARGPYNVDYPRLARSCWRVVDASPGSGFTAGQTFEAESSGVITLAGFARPVTLEGRVLYDDNTIVMAVEPRTIALDEAIILDGDASAVIDVMTREAWAERNAVHAWGERIATDELVDATAYPRAPAYPFTLHSTASGFVRSSWWKSGTTVEHVDLALGPGTRGRIAEYGEAIVVDSTLLLTDYDGTTPVVRHRIPLMAEPSELVGTYRGAILHVGNLLVHYSISSTTDMPVVRTFVVGAGVLLPAWGEAGYFFDGTRFHRIDTYPDLGFDEQWSFSPRADDLAKLGAPIAVHHDVVFGDNGLLARLDASDPRPGPRFASAADLFGDGAHIGPIAPESAAYLVRRGDGTAAVYAAPFVDYCE